MAYNYQNGDGERIFSPLYADVWDTTLKHLNGSAVKVYIALLMHTTQQDRTWFMSIDEIAVDAGVSRSAASEGKDKLIEVGLIHQRWRYRDAAGNYHLATKRPPPRLQGKNVYKVNVKPQDVESENQDVEVDRVRKSTPIESENQHLVESENHNQTITPTTQPPTEPLSPLAPQGEVVVQSKEVAKTTPKKLAAKGCRLEAGWMPSQPTIDRMAGQFPDMKFDAVHEEFTDYWLGVPGQRGVKLDWDATWRNWIRRAGNEGRYPRIQGRAPSTARQQPSKADQKAGWYLSKAEELAAEFAAEEGNHEA